MTRLASEDSNALGGQNKKINRMGTALMGNIVMSARLATLTTSATNTTTQTAANSRLVTFFLKQSAAPSTLHTWATGDIASVIYASLATVDTTTAATVSVSQATISFSGGIATTTISAVAGSFPATLTITCTCKDLTIAGATVASKTSVETFA